MSGPEVVVPKVVVPKVVVPKVVMAGSEAEAVAAFGDGSGVTVIGGGTVVTPMLTHGALWPQNVLLLQRAGLGGIVDGATLEIGAAATLATLADVAPEPLASAARIPDYEIRGQGTIGGNIMIGGDLQAALVALGARVRSAGAGGERVEPVADFIVATLGRLVLSVLVPRPRAGVFVQQRRRHSHTHPVLTVAVARRADGGVHVAVGSLAERAPAVGCPSVERALAGGAEPKEAAAKVVDDVSPEDDALASAWYRRRVLPVLVARALEQLAPAGPEMAR
jgi:CO/xanthine dehydrogenase FAD-binding subunit